MVRRGAWLRRCGMGVGVEAPQRGAAYPTRPVTQSQVDEQTSQTALAISPEVLNWSIGRPKAKDEEGFMLVASSMAAVAVCKFAHASLSPLDVRRRTGDHPARRPSRPVRARPRPLVDA